MDIKAMREAAIRHAERASQAATLVERGTAHTEVVRAITHAQAHSAAALALAAAIEAQR